MTIGGTNPDNRGIDALLPAEIAEKAEAIGVQKTKLDVLSLLALAVLAGAFIALGAMFATTVLAGADGVLPFGLSQPRWLALAHTVILHLAVQYADGHAWAGGPARLRLPSCTSPIVAHVALSLGRGAVASVALKLALDKATEPSITLSSLESM